MEDRPHWRRHSDACPFYRENWVNPEHPEFDDHDELVLYEIYCLKDTPPVTAAEQDLCFRSKHTCWRRHTSSPREPAGSAAAS